ncbi:MAG TPA: universal stress protein [Gemmatimonadota bacterium]
MSEIRSILVATDFSDAAGKAVRRASLIARDHGARLVALNVLEIPPEGLKGMGADPGEVATWFAEQLAREAGAAADRVGVEAEMATAFGKAFVEIVRKSRETGADLIVLGSHGESGWREDLLGATADRVVRKGDRPVLVVKRAATRPYARVLVGVDFSEHSRRALEAAAALTASSPATEAPDRDGGGRREGRSKSTRGRAGGGRASGTDVRSELHVLHVYGSLSQITLGRAALGGLVPTSAARSAAAEELERAREAMDALLAEVDTRGRSVEVHFREGSPMQEILRVTRTLRPGLLALGTHGRSGIPHVLFGSVAEAITRRAACDVLLVRRGTPVFSLP